MKMSNDHFVGLAMKVVGEQATPAEQTELDELIARQPELRTDFEHLRSAAKLAKETLPLINAMEEPQAGRLTGVREQPSSALSSFQLGGEPKFKQDNQGGEERRVASPRELPSYARGRLQMKVRETYGAGQTAEEKESFWSWRWLLGLATAAMAIVLIVLPALLPKPRVSVQVAMLDLAGTTRGADTNDIALLRQVWHDTQLENFSQASKLEEWEKTWPPETKGTVAKIIYDRSAGEIRVVGRHKGQPFQKTFPAEQNLPAALKLASDFVRAVAEGK